MGPKTIIRLLIIVGVLGVIFVLLKVFKEMKFERKLKISKEKITKVIITKKDSQITLTKSGEEWKIGPYKCDKVEVESLLDDLEEMTIGDLISEDKEDFKEFEVDKEEGIMVKLFEGDNEKVSFFIGKSGFAFGQHYFRYSDQNKIYLETGLERYSLDKSTDDWRDKTILSIERLTVENIEISYPKERVFLVQDIKTMKWYLDKIDKENEAKEDEVNDFLSTLLNLEADGFIYEPVELSEPEFTIVVNSKAGKYKLDIFEHKKDDETIYILKKEDDPNIYEIDEITRDDLKKKRKDFKK